MMRVTIGERLNISFRTPEAGRPEHTSEDVAPHGAVPEWVEPEKAGPVVRLADCRSSTLPYGHPTRRDDDGGPPRVTGHMEWIHKTAPVLVIHGRDAITPEEYAAGRRR